MSTVDYQTMVLIGIGFLAFCHGFQSGMHR